MEVKLLMNREMLLNMERNAAYATLTCHDNTERMKQPDYLPSDTLKHIIKAGHESILEHITLTFEIKNLSRACLQELARHRHISLSVESTRHTLKQKLLNGEIAINLPEDIDVVLLVMIKRHIQEIFDYFHKHPDVPNDILKYAMPECLATNLVMTVNIRELRHILELRTAPQALEEFRELCAKMFLAIPKEFQYLLEDKVLNGKEEELIK